MEFEAINQDYKLDILTVDDFQQKYAENKLGIVNFQNGPMLANEEILNFQRQNVHRPLPKELRKKSKFHVDMSELYEVIFDTSPLEEIVGVMSFGDAVHSPGYREVERVAKFLGFTYYKWTEKIYVHTCYVDFLVITKSIDDEIEAPPIYIKTNLPRAREFVTADAGYRIIWKPRNRLTNVMSMVKNGVPLIYGEGLDELLKEIKNDNPRKVYWKSKEKTDGIVT